MVVAAEPEGGFSAEANKFLHGLVSAKVRGVRDPLKGKAAAAWSRSALSLLGPQAQMVRFPCWVMC